jgi:hypothetical protein
MEPQKLRAVPASASVPLHCVKHTVHIPDVANDMKLWTQRYIYSMS